MSDEEISALIEASIRKSLEESILPTYKRILEDFKDMATTWARLLEQSEKRIDSTNRMISKLSEATEKGVTMFRMHIQSVEDTKKSALNNCTILAETNQKLSNLLETQTRQYSQMLNILSQHSDVIGSAGSSVQVNLSK